MPKVKSKRAFLSPILFAIVATIGLSAMLWAESTGFVFDWLKVHWSTLALWTICTWLALELILFVVALKFRNRSYSIQWIFWLTAAIAIYVSFFVTEQRRQEAIDEIDLVQDRNFADQEERDVLPREDERIGAPYLMSTINHRRVVVEVDFDLHERADCGCCIDAGPSVVNDQDLKWLKRFKFLETLKLPRSQITDDGLESIGKIPSLVELDLSDNELTGEGLAHLSRLENLHELKLNRNPINRKGLDLLAGLKNLRTLDVSSIALRDEHLQKIVPLQQLRKLTAHNTSILGNGLHELEKCESLRNISVQSKWKYATDKELERVLSLAVEPQRQRVKFEHHPNIEAVTYTLFPVFDSLELVNLPKLNSVDLTVQPCLHYINRRKEIYAMTNREEWLKQRAVFNRKPQVCELCQRRPTTVKLFELPKLNSVKLTNVQSLETKSLSSVKTLDLVDVNPNCLKQFSDLEELESLRIENRNFGSAESYIEFGRRTNVDRLELAGDKLNDEALEMLAGFSGLRHLKISSGRIGAAGMKHLASLESLETIEIERVICWDENVEALAVLNDLPNLQSIRLSGGVPKVSLVGLQNLTDFKFDGPVNHLRLENLPGITCWNRDGWNAIQSLVVENMPNLTQLEIGPNSNTLLESVEFRDVPNLKVLRLQSYRPNEHLTDDSFPFLESLVNLEELDLTHAQVSPAILERLKSLPKLQTTVVESELIP